MEYIDFLKTKRNTAPSVGFDVPESAMNPRMFGWQKDIVRWALKKGRAALFEDCGLGKTIQQLEWSRHVSSHMEKPVLIAAPLAVAEQTRREGQKFGYQVTVCRTQADVSPGLNVCNYEMLDHFDAAAFGGVVLDESSILKNYAGKVRNQIIEMFRDTPYRLSCTATPSPNDYMEQGNQAEFLGVMSRSEMLSMFFTHDGGSTSQWRLKGHGEDRFWQWMAGWAVVLASPKDLGYPEEGYQLPEKRVTEHIVDTAAPWMEEEPCLFTREARTLSERRHARRQSLEERCREAARLAAERPWEQWLIWCDLNDESGRLAELIPGAKEVRGSDRPEDKARVLDDFTQGKLRVLVTKPSIAGFGLNWQNCHNMIFVGLSDSFEMMYQAIRRCWRFGQKEEVQVHIISSRAEGAVLDNIRRKEEQCRRMEEKMRAYTKEILRHEIRGTVWEKMEYHPQMEMVLPPWIRRAA